MKILTATAVSKSFGTGNAKFWALKKMDISVSEQEFVAIMGTSGSGKSTLLNVLSGLDQPTTGEVILDGSFLNGCSENHLTEIRRQKIGFIFQSFNLIPVLTVLENVTLPFLLKSRLNKNVEKNAKELLNRVGLQDKYYAYPSELSGGQQQRVGIARALITNPKILMADEPTGSLDSNNSKEVLRIMREFCDNQGHSLVVVTHDSQVASYADRVLFLHDGELVDEVSLGQISPIINERRFIISQKMEEMV